MRREYSNGMLLACILFNSYGLLLSILLTVAAHHKLCSHQLLLFLEKVVTTYFFEYHPFSDLRIFTVFLLLFFTSALCCFLPSAFSQA